MNECRRLSIRLRRPIWIGLATVLLVVSGIVAVWQRGGLSASERRLVGAWAFRTCDKTNMLRIFEFREDRITVLRDVDQGLTDFYDWRVDGEFLLLTRYDQRDVNEPATRKFKRAAFVVAGIFHGRPMPEEPIEKYDILPRGPDMLELTFVRPGQSNSECVLKLVRVGEAARSTNH